jgi:hypothetical protein
LARQHLEADAARLEAAHRGDEVAEIASQPVELPGDQRIAIAQGLQAGGEPGSIVALARDVIDIEARDGAAGTSSVSRYGWGPERPQAVRR